MSGVSQYAVIDLRTLTPEQLNSMSMVLLFAEGGVAVASGSFTVEQLFFTTIDPSYLVLDDFVYADEAAFEANWTSRTNGSNAADPSNRLQLDADNDTMVLTAADPANGGWDLARRYATFTALGVPNGYKYIAFYVTNNTNRTDKTSIWLYWVAGITTGQNAFALTLPAVGSSGWVYVALPYQASFIVDFAIGFDNWVANPVTGSLVVHQIVATQTIPA
ncbi:MAG: hypothetical protein MZU97_00555 [Bacillus subtilis]|nr:hypothetical protein [Bacillus subtilis]